MAIQTSSEFYYRQWRRKDEFLSTLSASTSNFVLRKDVQGLKSLRVAAILDPFSVFSYAPECEFLNLDGTRYLDELQEFQPDLFFVESAWQGKDDAWKMDVRNASPKFMEVITWCRAHRVPIVFWNKEDPVHTNQFKKVAKLADFVFTTEADLIPQYKAWLGHERVYLLHFAAQPAQHNPLELYERKNRVCFAGAWYHLYPYRNLMLDHYLTMLKDKIGVDIYDRNYNIQNTVNKFPPEYSRYILGNLPPEQIDVAYKGYLYNLNMCSVTETSTMFARRVFELGASNTLIISNYSYGMKRYFGDLLICTDDMTEASQQLEERYTGSNARRMRLLMLRKILSEHLYEDRLDRIVWIVFGVHLKRALPEVYIVDGSKTAEEHRIVQDAFDAQTYPFRHLISENSVKEIPDDAYVGVFSPADHYAPNYLTDMMLSLRYCDREGFVKPGKPEEAYHPAETAVLRKSLVRMDVLRAQNCALKQDTEAVGRFLYIDEFNYQAGHATDWTEELDDIHVENQGIPTEKLESDTPYHPEWQYFSADDIYRTASPSDTETIKTNLLQGGVSVGNYAEKGCTYKWVTPILAREDYSALDNGLEICLNMDTIYGAEVVGACNFCTDGMRVDIGPVFLKANQPTRVEIPGKCIGFHLQVRIEAGSIVRIQSIAIRKAGKPLWYNRMRKSSTMILTNIYPRYDNLYRNMFVHERVRQYAEQGKEVQVFCLNDRVKEEVWRFEGQDVFSVHSSGLDLALEKMQTVCVHFLTAPMWAVLKKHLAHIRLLVWIHGFEIQPYTRRLFLYEGGDVPQEQIKASEDRQKLWKEVFETAEEADIRFVCVSRYFADEIAEDNGLPREYIQQHFTVIHNNVDEDCFQYHEKTEGHRLKLLSIRPYTSRTYANDVMVKCIQELAKRPFFHELQFSIYGDGALFDEITAPLKQYENVNVEKRFLLHEEIAQIYQDRGVLIVPTRMDSQGVSRDEAMHAGLVPITNAVAAVPEFCDESCAVLAPPEDYVAMADGIEKLYNDPELFLEMSRAAAETSHRNTSFAATIQKEIDLIFT